MVRDRGLGRLLYSLLAAVLVISACGGSGTSNASEMSPSANPCPRQVQAAFPAEFPTYPGATLMEDTVCTGFPDLPGQVEFVRDWSTSDSGKQVDVFYAAKLSQGQWTVTKVYPIESDGSTEVDFGVKNDPSLDGSVDYTAGSPANILVNIFTQNAEIEVNVTPKTTSNLPTGSATCGDPRAHVYSPDRLQLLAACVTVTGTVAMIRTESDGDLHVLLQLDSGQDKYINSKNISAENGDLVLEPVCVNTPTQADAISACAGYKNPLPIPTVGSHISVTGPWVLDVDHGWMEIHPVAAFNGVAAASPSIAAFPSPNPTPTTAPAVNLCGAPSNPWNYNFCSGNLISSPPSDFCSYFTCISSFWKGTGYVVQCGDATFSKSGGHTGVCSYHGGFKRNLYSA